MDGLQNLQKTPGKYTKFDFIDGSSYAYAYLTAEEKELVDIIDVNEGENKGKCLLENYQFLRFVNLNNNKLKNIDKVKNLQYLYELHAKTNEIESLEFLCDPSVSL